jgi:hypothetical protein
LLIKVSEEFVHALHRYGFCETRSKRSVKVVRGKKTASYPLLLLTVTENPAKL